MPSTVRFLFWEIKNTDRLAADAVLKRRTTRVCMSTVSSLKGLESISNFTQHSACGSVLG